MLERVRSHREAVPVHLPGLPLGVTISVLLWAVIVAVAEFGWPS